MKILKLNKYLWERPYILKLGNKKYNQFNTN